MKQTIFALAAMFALGGTAVAQEVKFGPKAGVNFSKQNHNDAKAHTGFHVGAVAEIKLGEKFSIQPEVQYSTQGSKVEREILGTKFSAKHQLDYVNVPVVAKFYVVDGLSIEAGPHVSFLAKESYEVKAGNLGVGGSNQKPFEAKKLDYGVSAGLAYDTPSGLFFNARYMIGLNDLRESDTTGDAVKSSVIQAGVGFKF
ncbi:porin family protein [Capnocytophaga sp. ARDL2]|uniref:porin family protein n=1 Tax=Capnocytophaga sp. ARDL2 TaxID=3238809 RepID=UPI00355619CF